MIGTDRGKASLMALMAAAMWGMWWIPIRYLNETGLPGAWSGLAINAATALVLLLLVLVRGGYGRIDIPTVAGAFLIGIAVASFAAAVSLTEVARAVLLFYLCPAWSTILECIFLNRRWNWSSVLAIGFSMLGLVLIFGNEILSASPGMGDLLALISGMTWATGSALLFTGRNQPISFLAMISMVGSAIVGLLSVLAWPDEFGHAPEMNDLVASLPVALLVATIYFLPMIMITIKSARVLAPALMSFLLSFEIVTGISSSAVMLDEVFGWRELSGTVCVILGAVTEFFIPARHGNDGKPDPVEGKS